MTVNLEYINRLICMCVERWWCFQKDNCFVSAEQKRNIAHFVVVTHVLQHCNGAGISGGRIILIYPPYPPLLSSSHGWYSTWIPFLVQSLKWSCNMLLTCLFLSVYLICSGISMTKVKSPKVMIIGVVICNACCV